MNTPLPTPPQKRSPQASSFIPVRSAAWFLVALLAFTGIAPLAVAQDDRGVIRGRVLNAQTGRYMERVVVQVEGTARRAFTNQFGEYELYGVPAGEVRLTASFTGMPTQTADVVVLAGERVAHDFTFRGRAPRPDDDDDIFELEEFEVRGADQFRTATEIAMQEERFSVNLRNVVDTEAYGITAQGNVGEFVKFMPGVTIGYGGTGAAGGTYSSPADANTISIRGFDPRETRVTIDGIGVANAAPGTLDPAVGLDMMSINNASRVEVIKVPTPDQPNTGLGGTVNLISKTAFEYTEPTLNFRVYVGLNSDNLTLFRRTPGPMNRPTYKARPSFDMTYAVPFSDSFGMTVTLASANQVNEENVLKARIRRDPLRTVTTRPQLRGADSVTSVGGEQFNFWLERDPRFSDWQQDYGQDWTQWTDDQFREMYSQAAPDATEVQINTALRNIKRLPKYDQEGNLVGAWSPADVERAENNLPILYDADGNRVGHVYPDWAHPYMNRIQVTDSPRISERNSAAVKLDWRPFEGVIISTSYQVSTFNDQTAGRRIHQIGDTPFEMGPTYSYSDGNQVGVRIDTDAFGREAITHSGYVRATYIRGPWNIGGHLSHSTSNSDLVSIENGHFSQVTLTLGGVDLVEYLDIDRFGAPQQINYYSYVRDDQNNIIGHEPINISTLDNYGLSGFDPENPDAGVLRVNSGGIESKSEVTSAKLDVRRDLDFLPFDFMNLAVKVGADWEQNKNSKTGRGVNYQYVYMGREPGAPIRPVDFRDENYRGVDPGFGMNPIEWPDNFALYRYWQENPEAFSDTDDRVPPGAGSVSVAHHNHIEFANTTKGITETRTAYYAQLEGDFLRNRLAIVGGFRLTRSERSGYDRGRNSNWNYLAFDRDDTGDGLREIFRNYEMPDGTVLSRLDMTNPSFITGTQGIYREYGTGDFDALPPEALERIAAHYLPYEQAGAVYPDGTPFIASEFRPLHPGEYRAAKYQYIPASPINQRAQTNPQPIISAAYDITDRLVARASWAITYSNPPYEDSEGAAGTLRRIEFNRNPDDDSGSMRVTNPNLEVARTMGWDVGLSYYTDTGGQFSIFGYHRTERNRAFDVLFTPEGSPQAWRQIMTDLGFGPGHLYYEREWTVNTSMNASGTFVDYGFELEGRHDLSFIPWLGDWGERFYLFGSYFTQYQEPGSVPEGEEQLFLVPDGMEKRINASGGVNFSYRRLNLRANFTWRNARLHDSQPITEGIIWDDATVGHPEWYAPGAQAPSNEDYTYRIRLMRPSDLRIDLSGSFRLTDNFTFDFSARNITESNPEPVYVREDGGSLGPMRYRDVHDGSDKILFGINFTVGISGRF
ncbi:MAG: TonB-dependent receptor plug domain-containing protein [Opitutales bacterium]|nr:TonB-dependent receptor plug domain-containing protein [Opitutales bacterium]